MADFVDVLIEDERWNDVGLAKLATSGAIAVWSFFGFDPAKYSISVLGCDDERIAALNSDFRENPGPTNVLSWPFAHLPAQTKAPYLPPDGSPEMPHDVGDIAISFDTCAREAEITGVDIQAHVIHLIVHSTLHLLGYDHILNEEAEDMEVLEAQVLATMGLADPYGLEQGR